MAGSGINYILYWAVENVEICVRNSKSCDSSHFAPCQCVIGMMILTGAGSQDGTGSWKETKTDPREVVL